jgi:hypothetical protein
MNLILSVLQRGREWQGSRVSASWFMLNEIFRGSAKNRSSRKFWNPSRRLAARVRAKVRPAFTKRQFAIDDGFIYFLIKSYRKNMRITVDIEDQKLDAVLKWTRQTKKSPAVAAAIDEFLEQKRRQAFLEKVLAGKTNYSMSNEKVESLARLEER